MMPACAWMLGGAVRRFERSMSSSQPRHWVKGAALVRSLRIYLLAEDGVAVAVATKCTQCKQIISDAAKFCPECGEKLSAEEKAASKTTQPLKTARRLKPVNSKTAKRQNSGGDNVTSSASNPKPVPEESGKSVRSFVNDVKASDFGDLGTAFEGVSRRNESDVVPGIAQSPADVPSNPKTFVPPEADKRQDAFRPSLRTVEGVNSTPEPTSFQLRDVDSRQQLRVASEGGQDLDDIDASDLLEKMLNGGMNSSGSVKAAGVKAVSGTRAKTTEDALPRGSVSTTAGHTTVTGLSMDTVANGVAKVPRQVPAPVAKATEDARPAVPAMPAVKAEVGRATNKLDDSDVIPLKDSSLLVDELLKPERPVRQPTPPSQEPVLVSGEATGAAATGQPMPVNQPLIAPPAVAAPPVPAPQLATQQPQAFQQNFPGFHPVNHSAAQGLPYHVPVPVPVPQYFPMPPSSGWSIPAVEQAKPLDSDGESKSIKTTLPPVESPSSVGNDQADKKTEAVTATEREGANQPISSESAAVLALDTDGDKTKVYSASEQKSALLRRFQKSCELAQEELRKVQEPIPQKIPRLIEKHIAKLESIDAAKIDEVIAQFNVLTKSASPVVLDVLTPYAKSQQPKIREACAQSLGEIPHALSAITLLDLLLDNSVAVVDAGIRGLFQLGYLQTVSPLVKLGRADGRCRAVMSDALAELDDESQAKLIEPLQEVLKSKGDPEASAFAVYLLSRIRSGSLLPMYMSLAKHKAPELRVAAVDAMAYSGENKSVRLLNAAMADSDHRVRCAAASGLAKISSPRSESLLIDALSDQHPSVRRCAAKTLTGFDGEQTAAAASKLINDESNPEVIEFLLEIVGKGGTDDALVTMQRYLDGDDIELRHRAITTLRRLKNPKGAALLAPFLNDSNTETRRLAVEAVGQLKHKSVLSMLQELLKCDPEEPVRAAAARSLGELKDQSSEVFLEDALRDCRLVRCQAVIALGQLKQKQSVPALLAQLRDAAPEVRYHACNALANIGELAETEPLLKLLEDNDAMVRRGAEAALTKLGQKVGRARISRRMRKWTANLMPSMIAGAIPGGSAMIAGLVILVGAAILYSTVDRIGFAAEPSFPVSQIGAIAISNDGAQVAIARKFNVLEVWDAKAGQLATRFQSESGGTSILYQVDGNALILSGPDSFTMDASKVAGSGADAIRPADLKGIQCHRVALTADRTKALLASTVGQATLINLTNASKGVSFKISDFTQDDAVAVSPDGKLAFVGTSKGELKVFSLEEGKLLGKIDIGKLIGSPSVAVTALDIDAKGATIAVGTSSGNVVVVSADSLEVLGKPYSKTGRIVGLAFMAKTSKLAVVSVRGELAVCAEDFSDSTMLTTKCSDAPSIISFCADGSIAAIAFSESDSFCVIDFAADAILAQYDSASR